MSTTTMTDRASITSAIEAAIAEFRTVVGEIGESGWKKKSSIPAWTCGQLAWHVATSVGFLTGQIEGGAKGKALNPPAFLHPVLYKASELRVRVASRKATAASVLADLDAGKARLLGVLSSLDDAALAASATFMGETRTIAEMFHRPLEHAAEHAAHIRAGLAA